MAFCALEDMVVIALVEAEGGFEVKGRKRREKKNDAIDEKKKNAMTMETELIIVGDVSEAKTTNFY